VLNFENILIEKFGLSDERASDFIEIFSEMIPGFSYDLIPNQKFFMRCRTIVNQLSKYRNEIRDEKIEIIETIHSLWKLPTESQLEYIKMWPDEWHKYLRKEEIETDDERVVCTAAEIANLILAKRYETTPTTINSYAKPTKWTGGVVAKPRLFK
jgi:hypothetical protein